MGKSTLDVMAKARGKTRKPSAAAGARRRRRSAGSAKERTVAPAPSQRTGLPSGRTGSSL